MKKLDFKAPLSALSTEICAEIEKAKQADIAMLGIINQALTILQYK